MNIVKESSINDSQASKISIQKNGTYALFCGQFDITIVTLNDLKTQVKSTIGKKSKEISTCQWSKHDDNIVIGLNNVCKIYDIELNKIHSLKGHSSRICSVDWHPGSKHQMISSSFDNGKSLCIWDIRKPDPLIGWKDGCVTQKVLWHKFNTFVFATSFNSDILLWDQRSISSPINDTTAHTSYVSNFDWLPRQDHSLISCGQYDKKIKMWNFSDDNEYLKCEIDDNSSMSHCKLNVTGDKLLTVTIPEIGGDNMLTLWTISDGYDVKKVTSSLPTTNAIVGFDWRTFSSDQNQIVTLHQNSDYKIWDVTGCVTSNKKMIRDPSGKRSSVSNDKFYLSQSPLSLGDISGNNATVGSENLTIMKTKESLDRMLPRYSDSNLSMRARAPPPVVNDIDSKIKKEFEKLTNNLQVTYEKVASERRVIAHLNLVNARCSIMFSYQCQCTDAVFLEASVVPDKSDKIRKQNVDELEKIVKNAASKNTFNVAKCVEVAMDYISKLSARFVMRSVRSIKDSSSGSNFYCNLPDTSVPFPRLCGAKFSPSGHLVCFQSPQGIFNKFQTIPRSFVEFVKHSSSGGSGKEYFHGYNAIPSKVTPHKTPKSGTRKNKAFESPGDSDFPSRMHSLTNLQKHNFLVSIYNTQRLSLFCPELAKKYCINVSDVEIMCEKNAAVVSDTNRRDLIEFWQYCVILAKASRPTINEFNNHIKPWPCQLFGRQMCMMWMDHFLKLLDVQSAAMLILVMMTIDERFDIDFETRYNYSTMAGNRRVVSQDGNQENQYVDNASITSVTSIGINVSLGGMKRYRMYDDRSNSVLVISGGSSDGQTRFYSNSFSEVDNQYAPLIKRPDTFPDMIARHRESCRLIDPGKLPQHGLIMLHYARMLSAQNLLTAATKITRKVLPATFFNNIHTQDQFLVKFIRGGSDSHSPQSSQLIIPDYTHLTSSVSHTPRTQVVLCSICRLSVNGLLSLCSQCHHGGHMSHISAWFSRTKSPGLCPTGCGCHCSTTTDGGQELSQTIFT